MGTTEKPAEATAKPALMKKLKIPLIIVAVVVIELVMVYLFFPTAAPPVASKEQEAMQELPAEPVEEEEEAEIDPHKPDKEVDLGEFSVTAHQAASNITYRVDFHLFGTVAEDMEEEYTKLMDAKGKRVREQVILTVRSAEMTDLADAGLGLIKRRILATTNKTLGKTCLQTVIFTEFRFNEQ
jgi:flagellar FliL protein